MQQENPTVIPIRLGRHVHKNALGFLHWVLLTLEVEKRTDHVDYVLWIFVDLPKELAHCIFHLHETDDFLELSIVSIFQIRRAIDFLIHSKHRVHHQKSRSLYEDRIILANIFLSLEVLARVAENHQRPVLVFTNRKEPEILLEELGLSLQEISRLVELI